MLTVNDPAVGAVTRRQLRELVAEQILDRDSLVLLERVLEKSRPRSSSGWCYLLARALGADGGPALELASCVEVICSAIDFIDDVQDGDSEAYLSDVPWQIQVNLGVQMVTVFSLLCARLQARQALTTAFPAEAMAGLTAMGCGQRLELSRQAWSCDSYQRMAELTGGRQLEIYFRAAAWVAGAEVQPFLGLCPPLGFLLHIVNDLGAQDPRFLDLRQDEMQQRRARATGELERAAAAVPEPALAVVKLLLEYAQRGDKHA